MHVERLTFAQQASRGIEDKGRPLAIKVKGPRGMERRAVELIPNLEALLSVKGVTIRCFTPKGHALNAAQLVGKTILQIDALAASIDKLDKVVPKEPRWLFDY